MVGAQLQCHIGVFLLDWSFSMTRSVAAFVWANCEGLDSRDIAPCIYYNRIQYKFGMDRLRVIACDMIKDLEGNDRIINRPRDRNHEKRCADFTKSRMLGLWWFKCASINWGDRCCWMQIITESVLLNNKQN